jgi:hypothetical protein
MTRTLLTHKLTDYRAVWSRLEHQAVLRLVYGICSSAPIPPYGVPAKYEGKVVRTLTNPKNGAPAERARRIIFSTARSRRTACILWWPAPASPTSTRPDQVADAIHAARQTTLNDAFNRNPERSVRKEPRPPAKPMAWINPPCLAPQPQAFPPPLYSRVSGV